ncbi:type II secretion system protein [Candidatus Wolfebacteria bacterium]|nr:type II secretion system protein [Candidatus Wolfebacteria bacterium]
MQENTQSKKKGFTLLELLIVIAIISVLAAVAIFVLNPAETLREARDTQRVADLATLKTALALYVTKTTSTIAFDGNSNNYCRNGTGGNRLFYSTPDSVPITDIILDGGVFTTSSQATAANYTLTDGNGWIKTNLSGSLVGGSPISDMPVDPTNDITAGVSTAANVSSTALVYRFACDKGDSTFELNSKLESLSIGAKAAKDGGNNSLLYEAGTKLTILGSGSDF